MDSNNQPSSATKRKSDDQSEPSVESKRHHQSEESESPPPSKMKIDELPTDLLAKVIRYVPIGQWRSLETVNPYFRDSTFEAWKTVKKIRVFDDLLASVKFAYDLVGEQAMNTVLETLSKRATNLEEIGGFPKLIPAACGRLVPEFVEYDWLKYFAELESLRRIEIGDHAYTKLGDLITFLDESMSRDQLKELIVKETFVDNGTDESEKATATYDSSSSDSDSEELSSFYSVSSFGDDETKQKRLECIELHRRLTLAFDNVDRMRPLRLETINLEKNETKLICWPDKSLSYKFLQTMDVSQLTTFLAMGTFVPQRRLAAFFDRATNLRRISFDLTCTYEDGTPHILRSHVDAEIPIARVREQNVDILTAVAGLVRLESLTISTGVGALTSCKCRKLSSEISALFATLGWRRGEDGKARFKELQLLHQMASYEFVSSIAKFLPNLQSLSLETAHLDGEELKHVFRSQTMLRKLRLENCDLHKSYSAASHVLFGIDDLFGFANTLESLSIDFQLDGAIVGDWKPLARLHGLTELLLNMGDAPEARNVDDFVLLAWAHGFGARLKSFEINGRFSISMDGLMRFLSKTPRLETFRLGDIRISDQFLRRLPTLCPMIEEIRIQRGEKATLEAIQDLVDGCGRLKILCFDYTTKWFPSQLKPSKYRKIRFLDEEMW